MRFLRILLSIGIVSIILLAVVFYVLSRHSVKKIVLVCSGSWGQEINQPESVVAVIEEYLPWVLWGESYGNLRAESRNVPVVMYAGYVQRVGQEPMTMYQFRLDENGTIIGMYRRSFSELKLQFSDKLIFQGTCKQR